MAIKVIMPEMGEGVVEGTISRWLKQVGESVDQYEPLLEIETDKVTTEATAEEAGTLLEILVPEGETVDVGTVLATIGQPGEAPPTNGHAPAKAPAPQPEPTPASAAPVATAVSHPPTPQQRYTGRISPVVGRIAAEHEVDLNMVNGTGRDGRITKNDILAHIEQRQTTVISQPIPESTPTQQTEKPISVTPSPRHPVTLSPEPTPGEIVPLTNMRRAIAEHMVRSVQTSPHVTTVFEFDFTAVSHHRAVHKAQFARDGANLTFTAYIVAATVAALKQHPMANSTWTDQGIELKRQINIGMAAAIDDGLIVPVIKGADGMNLLGLARTINDLTERARNKQLQPGDVQGGTFSITNHGTSGSLFATPIINQPQCGILGVGKIEKRVKVINDAIAIRPLAYVSFTFDHRILDGKTADDFVSTIKQVIENWQ
ncbi:MAG: 2-oxo acid dehydrogenase subunit E2 [Ardenticatenaceae bacterium]|nr:2-oxo acid dehydrogenase subunit E2 [Anaerolineales bacterium]MCB8939748.1 2-oxo acid dehydrogenase subunit E2 [Ardenticatenaceae bacterium]MCB8975168.1 2-oxo acid dehydrogenase subunit E2 [Ardenticatenaceae bacterium]